MSKDCVICCEKINISNRKEVNCVFCDYVACRSCFQTYITETSLDPHCMNCKKTFPPDFVNDNCTNVFVTKNLKKHRENLLLDREKSLLQETQPYVVVENKKREINSKIRELHDKKYELRKQERLLDAQISNLYEEVRNVSHDGIDVSDERKKFIRKCPMETCRGFLSSQWKCGSCEKKICNKCNEENQTGHECNPENVASMELLNKDTKPCPNCGTMIFKISGCSQMYCVDCHTAWDWNTSRIVTGVIHNPHYYDFIRNGGGGGRNHGDIPCGGLPDIDSLHHLFKAISFAGSGSIYNIHQCITHIQNYEMRNHRLEDNVATNRSLRIRYLMNELDETEFKVVLQQNEKKRQKNAAFHNIYQMFIDVGSDILRQIVVFIREKKPKVNQRSIPECITFVEENLLILNNLIGYFNDSFKKVGKIYKCVYPGITKDMIFANNIETANRRAS